MYLKKILRPSIKVSENFAALYQSGVIFHSDLDKELSKFPKILTFFVKTHSNNFQIALERMNGKISGVLLCWMCALLIWNAKILT